MTNKKCIAAEVLVFLIALISAYLWSSNMSVMFLSDDRSAYFCDQVLFEFIGKAWANGIPAYTYYFDHKGPVVFLFFCIGYLIDGTRRGVMLVHSIWTAVSIYLLHRILFQMDLFKSYITNLVMSAISSIITILLLWSWNVQSGVVVAQIEMPFILTCTWIICEWYKTDSFLSGRRLHFLYGISCMMIIMARASDAIFIFTTYIGLLCVHIKHKQKLFQNLCVILLGGFLPFAMFLSYFGYYGVVDTFMDCTLWSNFRYAAKSASTDASCTYVWAILLFVMLVALFIIAWHRKASGLAPYCVASGLHLLFYISTTRFTQYCIAFLADIVILLFIAFYGYKITTRCRKRIFGILFGIYVMFFVSTEIVTAGYITWYHGTQECIRQYDEALRDELIASGKSYMTYNDEYLLATMMESDYELPVCKYILFQDWHVDCGVIELAELQSAIKESSPDVIITLDKSAYADELFVDYELTDVYELWRDSDGVYDEVYTYYTYEKIEE